MTLLPKPPWACYIWCDDTHIYLETPCPTGKVPHATAFAKTEGGMSKALAIVAQLSNKDRAPPAPGYFRHGKAKPPAPKLPRATPNAALADAAKRVLKRMGLV